MQSLAPVTAWFMFAALGGACTSSSSSDGTGDQVADDGLPTPAVCGNLATESGEQCDDGNAVDGDGCSATCQTEPRILANWRFASRAGTNTGCPPNVRGIEIVTQPIDATGNPVGAPGDDIYDCAVYSGMRAPLSPGRLNVYLNALGAQDAVMYQTLSQVIDFTGGSQTVDFSFVSDGGFIVFDWNLVRAATNAPLTCAQANATSVEIVDTLSGTTAAHSDIYNCDAHYGVTDPLAPGQYTASISANSAAGALGAPVNKTVAVTAPNGITDIGSITLPID